MTLRNNLSDIPNEEKICIGKAAVTLRARQDELFEECLAPLLQIEDFHVESDMVYRPSLPYATFRRKIVENYNTKEWKIKDF